MVQCIYSRLLSIPFSESIDVLLYKKKKGPFFMLVKAFAAGNLGYETHT